MKYYHEFKTITYSDGDSRECDMGYNIANLPTNKPIWAVAYDINNETTHVNLKCLPTIGEIIPDYDPVLSKFRAYKKGSSEFRSGWVYFESRWYADTFEEAVELYNELVQMRIERILAILEDAKGDILT